MNVIMIVITLVSFGILIIIGEQVFESLNTDIQASSDMSEDSKVATQRLYDRYSTFFDSLFVFLFILLWIFVIVSALIANEHPVIFVMSIILMVFVVYAAYEFSNFYDDMTNDVELSSYAVNYPMMNTILDNLGTFIIVMMASILIFAYGKNRYFGAGT